MCPRRPGAVATKPISGGDLRRHRACARATRWTPPFVDLRLADPLPRRRTRKKPATCAGFIDRLASVRLACGSLRVAGWRKAGWQRGASLAASAVAMLERESLAVAQCGLRPRWRLENSWKYSSASTPSFQRGSSTARLVKREPLERQHGSQLDQPCCRRTPRRDDGSTAFRWTGMPRIHGTPR